jgi:diguanylate cyclase (GGDEF)-like protein/putative nucleotidyltransferase with HDIG domain
VEESTRILVIESDAATLGARSAIIKKAGYIPITIAWPANLASLIEAHAPHVVMLGMAPGESWAFEVCADLRLTDPAHDLPVLLVVGDREHDAIEQGLKAGADDVVRASVSAGELHARFEVQLRNRRHRDALRSASSERDRLRLKATVDPLTQVLNRGALEETLGTELSRGSTFTVMFVDIDHFKSVNDKYGHDIGDNVLKAVSGQLRRAIRSNDIAGRYGGEEFVVCLVGCDESYAPTIAERHRGWIAGLTFPKEKYPERVTVSIGVAVFNPAIPDTSLSALLKRADNALYQAKNAGRNLVVVAPALKKSVEEEAAATLAQSISRSLLPVAPKSEPSNAISLLEAELVKQLNEGHTPLPAIPSVAMAALRMAQQPNVDFADLSALIEQDPFMTARFLAVGNSAAYYRGFRSASIRDAIIRIGLAEVRDILASIAYSASLSKYNDLLEQFSERSTLAARYAVNACRELRWNYEPAYLCGLLHDVGEARVLRILATLPKPAGGKPVITELIERYHTQAGAQLAEKWNLHSDIVQACALHHDPNQWEPRPVRLAMISDLFVYLASLPSKAGPDELQLALYKKYGLSEIQVRNILKTT